MVLSVFFFSELEAEIVKSVDNVFERFLTEVTNLDHLIFCFIYKVLYRINTCSLEAVKATNGHAKFFNGHLKNPVTLGFFAFNKDLGLLCFVAELDEQIEMFSEKLCAKGNCFLSGNRTVGLNFNRKLIEVGVITYAGIFNLVLYVIYGSI